MRLCFARARVGFAAVFLTSLAACTAEPEAPPADPAAQAPLMPRACDEVVFVERIEQDPVYYVVRNVDGEDAKAGPSQTICWGRYTGGTLAFDFTGVPFAGGRPVRDTLRYDGGRLERTVADDVADSSYIYTVRLQPPGDTTWHDVRAVAEWLAPGQPPFTEIRPRVIIER